MVRCDGSETICEGRPLNPSANNTPLPPANPTPVTASSSEKIDKAGERLPFLDGVRGFLALLVFFGHLNQFTGDPFGNGGLIALGYRVPAFFALSGFVQYLSSAKLEGVALNVPYDLFVRRRSLRLLPAYYAGLFFCLGLAFFLQVTHLTGPRIDAAYLQSFGVHLLLLQSWASVHTQAIVNTPIWMMGYETLFSLSLPLLLLIARRLTWATLVIALIALMFVPGTGPTRLLMPPGLLLSFIFGMMAARAARRIPADTKILSVVPVRYLSVIAIVGGFSAFFGLRPLMHDYYWQIESRIGWIVQASAGLAMAGICVALTYAPRGVLARAFSSAPFVRIGRISYSLFLIHYPLLMYCSWAVAKLPRGFPIWIPYAVLTPIIFALAYLFFRLFEAPFQKSNRKE